MSRPFVGLAGLLFVGGLLVSDMILVEESTEQVVVTPSLQISAPEVFDDAPPEAQPPEVAPPRRILIPDLNIDAAIVPVGMADAATMEVPDDIRIVGWFLFGSSPADTEGSTVLVGHRDGTKDPNGVFRNIGELKVDALIEVVDAGDVAWRYGIDAVDVMSVSDFAQRADRIFDYESEHRLILLTCGGSYQRSNGGYQSTVVVTATPR
jgi:hypothetical protein